MVRFADVVLIINGSETLICPVYRDSPRGPQHIALVGIRVAS